MATTSLIRTPSSTGNRKTFTFSAWFKRTGLGVIGNLFSQYAGSGTGADKHFRVRFNTNNTIGVAAYSTDVLVTNRVFRDTSAWYHLTLAVDTTQATDSNRVKLYINGTQETSFSSTNYPSQNFDYAVNTASYPIRIGADDSDGNGPYGWFDGLMSHVHLADGTAYQASDFGETDSTTGEWKIKTSPSVTYGNNGFFILKDGNSVTDQSGNSNNFTVAGGTLTNTEDCPSNVFATINTLQGTIASGYTIENGNLSTNGTSSNTWRSLPATLASSSGKFYWEIKVASFSYAIHFGIQDVDQAVQTDNYAYQYSRAYMYLNDGTKNNGGSGSSYGNSWTTNDIIGVALDMDNLKLYFSKNGVWQNSGDPTSGSTGTGSAFTLASGYAYTPMFSSHSSSDKYQINFGNGYFGTTAISSEGTNASGIGKFEYDVPTGYTALSTKGLNL